MARGDARGGLFAKYLRKARGGPMTTVTMRPSPLVLLALVAIGFALIALPLTRLTGAADAAWTPRAEPTAGGSADPSTTGAVESLIRLRFAHAPISVRIQQNGVELAALGAPTDPLSGQIEIRQSLTLSAGPSLDVLVEATWPAGTPATARGVEVEPDGQETRRTTVWTDTPTLSELVTFSWP